MNVYTGLIPSLHHQPMLAVYHTAYSQIEFHPYILSLAHAYRKYKRYS